MDASTKLADVIGKAKDRADQEIIRRITSLTALKTRVNGIVKLSADQKTNLSSLLDTQIGAMNDLTAKIAADASANSTSSLKIDIQSITKAYRIYMLVLPRGTITVAADQILDVADTMSAFAVKLQGRGVSVTALADMNAKIADAKVQVQAAIDEVSGLNPDNGDQTIMQTNTTALKDARAKLKIARADLETARQDVRAIVKTLGGSVTVSASTTASGTTQQ